jgi:hypothetical protein
MAGKPRNRASATDPRCIDYRSGVLIGDAMDAHRDATGENLKTISANVAIGIESLYSYQRGHQVPTPASREKLERYFGLADGALIPKPYRNGDVQFGVNEQGFTTTKVVEDGYLVITTRIPLTEVTA